MTGACALFLLEIGAWSGGAPKWWKWASMEEGKGRVTFSVVECVALLQLTACSAPPHLSFHHIQHYVSMINGGGEHNAINGCSAYIRGGTDMGCSKC